MAWDAVCDDGAGREKGYALKEPISHVDQMPTILRLLNIPIPSHVQGRVLNEILK